MVRLHARPGVRGLGGTLALLSALAVLCVAVLMGAAGSASATSYRDVGTITGRDSRCATSPYYECLYYSSSWSSAYWGTNANVGTISAHFLSGTGTGSGKAVRNDAHLVACDIVIDECDTFVSPNYNGNDDWAFSGTRGTLYYTLNNEASVHLYTY
jgi:hypothetical protein